VVYYLSVMTTKAAQFVPGDVAAMRLGVPRAWFRREADAGRVPFLGVGRRRLFDVETVRLALLDRAKVEYLAVLTQEHEKVMTPE